MSHPFRGHAAQEQGVTVPSELGGWLQQGEVRFVTKPCWFLGSVVYYEGLIRSVSTAVFSVMLDASGHPWVCAVTRSLLPSPLTWHTQVLTLSAPRASTWKRVQTLGSDSVC